MRRILITGQLGMLGSELSLACEDQGDEVTGFSLPEVDITDRERVLRLAGEADPEFIFHCAAFTNVDQCETDPEQAMRVNAIGTQNMALAAESLGVPLLYVSTDYIFDGTKDSPYDEWDAGNPRSVYGKSKYAGEQFVRAICPWFYIVRVSWLCGKNGPNFIETILKLARERDELKVVNDQHGSPTFVADLVPELIRISESGAFGTYHVTNQGYTTWYEFAKKALELKGVTTPVMPCTSKEHPRPAPRPKNSRLSPALYALALGNEMPTWEEGLKDYLKR
ncbi:dTDP-4-dehydrorhamnose reductase [bacterium]|nr:dTDP-4-dehydrorhamnose reductase [bacterium]